MIQNNLITRKPVNKASFTQQAQKRDSKEFNQILLFSLLHLPVGLFLYNAGPLALLHPIGVFILGIYWAFVKNVSLERIAYLVAYLVGCEILWRMSGTPIFWEFGKYGASAIMLAILMRKELFRIPPLPLIFFVLLIPSCFLTLALTDLPDARARISFYLSGPFCLFVSCWFFSHVKFNKILIKRLLIALIIPLLTVAATTLFYTVTADEISFSTESNFATSGGFGPNQVSSMLGLGSFLASACLILFNKDTLKFKIYFAFAAVFLAIQSVMTFSRGGMYNAVGALVILVIFQFQNMSEGIKKILPLILLVLVFLFSIFPYLNDFTGGKLEERFEDTGTTNRAEIIESELQIFSENPVFGVGLGMSRKYHEENLGFGTATHTEFSRLISEHGSLGLISLLAIISMCFMNVWRQKTIFGRSLVAGLLVWCSLFMLNAAFRLSAPAFVWGITFITITSFPVIRKRRIVARKPVMKYKEQDED